MGLGLTGQIKATAVVVAVASGLMFTNSASAEQINLKSTDGLINLSGQLVDFMDNSYTLRTPTGELRINARHVWCEGSGCPPFDAASAYVIINRSDAS